MSVKTIFLNHFFAKKILVHFIKHRMTSFKNGRHNHSLDVICEKRLGNGYKEPEAKQLVVNTLNDYVNYIVELANDLRKPVLSEKVVQGLIEVTLKKCCRPNSAEAKEDTRENNNKQKVVNNIPTHRLREYIKNRRAESISRNTSANVTAQTSVSTKGIIYLAAALGNIQQKITDVARKNAVATTRKLLDANDIALGISSVFGDSTKAQTMYLIQPEVSYGTQENWKGYLKDRVQQTIRDDYIENAKTTDADKGLQSGAMLAAKKGGIIRMRADTKAIVTKIAVLETAELQRIATVLANIDRVKMATESHCQLAIKIHDKTEGRFSRVNTITKSIKTRTRKKKANATASSTRRTLGYCQKSLRMHKNLQKRRNTFTTAVADRVLKGITPAGRSTIMTAVTNYITSVSHLAQISASSHGAASPGGGDFAAVRAISRVLPKSCTGSTVEIKSTKTFLKEDCKKKKSKSPRNSFQIETAPRQSARIAAQNKNNLM